MAKPLNLAALTQLVGSLSKRHAVTVQTTAPTARGRAVSGAVSLPSRGAFHLSLTVLVRYRSQESVQPWRVVPPDSTRIPRGRAYSGRRSRGPGRFAYGALTPCGRPSQAVRLRAGFVTAPRVFGPRAVSPRNTGTPAPQGCDGRAGLGIARVRSPLLARSRLISLPPGT